MFYIRLVLDDYYKHDYKFFVEYQTAYCKSHTRRTMMDGNIPRAESKHVKNEIDFHKLRIRDLQKLSFLKVKQNKIKQLIND